MRTMQIDTREICEEGAVGGGKRRKLRESFVEDSEGEASFSDPYYLANFKSCLLYVNSSLDGHVITSKNSLIKDFNDLDGKSDLFHCQY